MLRKKNKQLIAAVIVTIIVLSIPFLITFFSLRSKMQSYHTKLMVCQQQLEDIHTVDTAVLKHALRAGERIGKEDIEMVSMQVSKKETLMLSGKSDLLGKYIKTRMEKGTLLNKALVYEGEAVTDDMRLVDISMVKLPKELSDTDFMDIRIRYPNGEDYVVVQHKKIEPLEQTTPVPLEDGKEETPQTNTNTRTEEVKEQAEPVQNVMPDTASGITIQQSNSSDDTAGQEQKVSMKEEELLRFASAAVDQKQFDGTMLYAVRYVGDFQKSAKTDYPVNAQVFKLMSWDPNLYEYQPSKLEQIHRKVLEKNLKKFMERTKITLPGF